MNNNKEQMHAFSIATEQFFESGDKPVES